MQSNSCRLLLTLACDEDKQIQGGQQGCPYYKLSGMDVLSVLLLAWTAMAGATQGLSLLYFIAAQRYGITQGSTQCAVLKNFVTDSPWSKSMSVLK